MLVAIFFMIFAAHMNILFIGKTNIMFLITWSYSLTPPPFMLTIESIMVDKF